MFVDYIVSFNFVAISPSVYAVCSCNHASFGCSSRLHHGVDSTGFTLSRIARCDLHHQRIEKSRDMTFTKFVGVDIDLDEFFSVLEGFVNFSKWEV